MWPTASREVSTFLHPDTEAMKAELYTKYRAPSVLYL
jgi:hypothetical protein